ncbi:hypothetical protein [Butyrivibrio fibrisolvens]|uniref:hypothetical protein n=1 Tax=Butyrivibrio fibrisolvens TaxID=831 RepID=UPI0004137F04|nr:hypothetical protein [Butyrivibrio fibrisolvens]
MKKQFLQLFLAIVFTFSLVACDKISYTLNTDSNNDEDASTDQEDMQDLPEDFYEIRFDGNIYNLDASLSELCNEVYENGDAVYNCRTCCLINADGTDSGIVWKPDSEYASSQLFPVLVQDEDGFCLTSFFFEYNNLSNFNTADHITQFTDVDKIPSYYTALDNGSSTNISSYAVLLCDGIPYDIQNYIDQLPETASSELVDEISSTLKIVKPIKNGLTILFIGPWKDTFETDYNSSAEYRNNVAFLQAIENIYQSVRNGETKQMGLCYLHFINNKLSKVYISIYTKSSTGTDA